MLRGVILSLTIVLSLHAACSTAGLARSPSVDDLIEQDTTMIEPHVRQVREIGSILLAVKDQFKEIIEDLLFGALRSLRMFMVQTRDRLLKTLENYTFSDVLRGVLNIVSESIFEPTVLTEIVEEPVAIERVEVKPVEVKVYRNPYSLTSLRQTLNH